MRYTPRSRDRSTRVLALLTGLATFGSLTATGALTGMAARQTAARDRARQQADAFTTAQRQEAAARLAEQQRSRRVLLSVTERPSRTVVHTRVVHAASGPGVAAVGAGGTLTATSGYPTGGSGGSGSGGAAGNPAPAPAAAPPPPAAPAPAPSSGS